MDTIKKFFGTVKNNETIYDAATIDKMFDDVKNQISEKSSSVSVSDLINDKTYNLSNVVKISKSEYNEKLINNDIQDTTLYVVDSDINDAYGKTIVNVAAPENDSDAATKEYVDKNTCKNIIKSELEKLFKNCSINNKTSISINDIVECLKSISEKL